MSIALGLGVPAHTPHAISVSLPTWEDNIGYEEGDRRVVDAMVSGYPRFFIHLSIRALAAHCEHKYAVGDEQCMLFPTLSIAEECRDFVRRCSRIPIQPRLVQLFISPHVGHLHLVLIPAQAFSLAKQFWQHTGLGISSRLAECCLALLKDKPPQHECLSPPLSAKGHNRHYSVKSTSPPTRPTQHELFSSDHITYLEERYGRNLPIVQAASAKRALRRRIAGTVVCDDTITNDNDNDTDEPSAGKESFKTVPSTRGVEALTEDDVYLFPCGMAAIWTAHRLLRETRPEAKSVCFGFPYTDTLKILQKWGIGAHFFGNGLDKDIDALEQLLNTLSFSRPGDNPPILALFTEFPSNPLLRSPNLPKLRALADVYDFLIVVDETIGNFENVNVLPYADIVVSSLTKVFSGASNVMGGSLILNSQSKHYSTLKHHLEKTYEDTFFAEDAIYLERNSRDFRRRVRIINHNTLQIVSYLYSRSLLAPLPATGGGGRPNHPAIKCIYYPSLTTRENYSQCLSVPASYSHPTPSSTPSYSRGGYGGLFSLTFTTSLASETFFDNLACNKGPSLGTDFTLACPYTILAHYNELDWAERYGVEKGLVRVSVGLEDCEWLRGVFEEAVRAAEGVVATEREREVQGDVNKNGL